MSLYYRLAADAVVLFHMTYVLVVVLGLPAIWIGILCRSQWARNFWWRCGHLSMIVIVVAETWAGITCPLTTWEHHLRELAHQETYAGDFIANLIHDWLFWEAPPWSSRPPIRCSACWCWRRSLSHRLDGHGLDNDGLGK